MEAEKLLAIVKIRRVRQALQRRAVTQAAARLSAARAGLESAMRAAAREARQTQEQVEGLRSTIRSGVVRSGEIIGAAHGTELAMEGLRHKIARVALLKDRAEEAEQRWREVVADLRRDIRLCEALEARARAALCAAEGRRGEMLGEETIDQMAFAGAG